MADELLTQAPSEYLRDECPEAADAFREVRNALIACGPLDPATCELIVIALVGSAGFEYSFKAHCRRHLDLGGSVDALRHTMLVTFGTATSLFQVARALEWINELKRESDVG